MQTFKDAQGRVWELQINIAAVKRIKAACNVDLMDLVRGGEAAKSCMSELMSNPVVVCDVLYALVMPRAEKAGITDEQFGESLYSDVLENATDALIQELIDFFPKGQRHLLKRAQAKIAEMQELMLAEAEKQIDALTVEKVQRILGESSTERLDSVA